MHFAAGLFSFFEVIIFGGFSLTTLVAMLVSVDRLPREKVGDLLAFIT